MLADITEIVDALMALPDMPFGEIRSMSIAKQAKQLLGALVDSKAAYNEQWGALPRNSRVSEDIKDTAAALHKFLEGMAAGVLLQTLEMKPSVLAL